MDYYRNGFDGGYLYNYRGLSSAINADMIQSIILIAGSVLLSIFCFNSVGGWENFVEHFHDGVWLNLIRPNSDTTVPWFSIFCLFLFWDFIFGEIIKS